MGILDVLKFPYKPANGTLALDLNHWLGKPDFDVMEARFFELGYTPVVINKATDFVAGTAKGFLDITAERFYQETTRRGWRNGFFHWLQPKTDPTVQAQYYLDYWLQHRTWMRPIVDFEDRDMNSPSDYLWRLQVWLEIVEAETGVAPIVYTGNGFMKEFFSAIKSKTGFLKRNPLWLAWYSAWIPEAPYPWAWEDIAMWQYSAKADYPYYKNPGTNAGKLYGVESPSLDMDWVMMPYDQMDVLSCGADTAPVVTEPEVEPIPVDVVDYTSALMTANTDMRLRSKPDLTAASQIGILPAGETVEVTGEIVQANGYNWLPVNYKGFVALSRIGAEGAPFFTVKE